jgi:hypothetical protein
MKHGMHQTVETTKPFKVEVIADNSGIWAGNALRFDTVEAAIDYATDLYSRWTLVSQMRVVNNESGEVVWKEPS